MKPGYIIDNTIPTKVCAVIGVYNWEDLYKVVNLAQVKKHDYDKNYPLVGYWKPKTKFYDF